MIGALLLVGVAVLAELAAMYRIDRPPVSTNAMPRLTVAGISWSHYMHATSMPGSKGTIVEISIRWWHAGAWLMFLRALGRKFGLLRELCPTCAGNGRLMERLGSTRRIQCPDCHGHRYARRGQ